LRGYRSIRRPISRFLLATTPPRGVDYHRLPRRPPASVGDRPMLRVLGSPKRLCDGLTRREMLTAGSVGLCGLTRADYLRLSEAQASRPDRPPHFGKAKSCILLFLYGSPSQLETFDPKPDAPVEIRGELKSIRSRVAGMDVGELLPQVAKVTDKFTVLRS